MKYGHRQFLDPVQVKSSTGRNTEAWPLRVNERRVGAVSRPISLRSTEPVVSAHSGNGRG
jgi:hypothetical protein